MRELVAGVALVPRQVCAPTQIPHARPWLLPVCACAQSVPVSCSGPTLPGACAARARDETRRVTLFRVLLQRAGLVRHFATLVAVALCAYAACSMYYSTSDDGVELLQTSNVAHRRHVIHGLHGRAKAMKVCFARPRAVSA